MLSAGDTFLMSCLYAARGHTFSRPHALPDSLPEAFKSPSWRGEQWTVTTDYSSVSSSGYHSHIGRLKQQHGNLDAQAEFYQISYHRPLCKNVHVGKI